MKIFCTSLVFGLLALLALPCRADELKDCAGCKDHPLLARYPGSILLGADQKEFEEAVLPAGVGVRSEGGDDVAPKVLDVSGRRTRLFYFAPPERSALEVFLNYKQALEKSGMSMLWTCADKECGDGFADQALETMHLKLDNTAESALGFVNAERPRYLLAKLARPQGDVYVMVMAADKTDQQRPATFVVIVESKPMEVGMVTVAASALDQSLMSTGKAVIYGIYFDFDKADVKPASSPQLQEIAALLNTHADLKLAITGHTDNQGSADYNQKLSQRRADAIVAALTGSYAIAANRLSAQGLGPSAPVASNDTDEGRAKNRRVELVKQ